MRERRSRSRDKEMKEVKDESVMTPFIDIYNIPQHFNKDDIVYFLWKTLDKCKALKKSSNPIIKSDHVPELNCIRIILRSKEEALNCLDLNGIYYGVKAFYMKSQLQPRQHPAIDTRNIKLRRISPFVQDGFNKIYIGNFPFMPDYQIINILTEIAQLQSYQPINTNKTGSQCFCQFKFQQQTEDSLVKINNLKIKGRPIIAKRAALMNTAETSKFSNNKPSTTTRVISRPKSNLFQKDLQSFYVTFDTVGFFKSMKISCVLQLKNIAPLNAEIEPIKKDIEKQMSKIGKIIKICSKDRNVYVEYERVEYAQIAYLILMNRRYDSKPVEMLFYDPINFADDILM